MKPEAVGIAIVAGLVGLGLVGLYVWKKGGIANAAAGVGGAVVDAAGGVASGVVGGIGESVGLPTPAQTSTDAEVSRWIIDNYGWFEASKWTGAPALARAMLMDAGTGKPPAPGTDLAQRFPPKATPTSGDFARLDRASSGYGSSGEGSGLLWGIFPTFTDDRAYTGGATGSW